VDVVTPRRFDVMLVTLDPTVGSEIRKTRPCLVVSPDEMNRHVRTIIIAPMTTSERAYPTRVPISFQGKSGQVALDQIRAVDRARLVRQVGQADPQTSEAVSDTLVAMFAYDFQPPVPPR
jgi:mRNA interferase MazF